MANNSINLNRADTLCFFEDSIKYLPRLLSLLDRNPSSPTYGCFDRNYWHYKTQIDFPSAPYQYGTLILTLCYKNQFDHNIYYNNSDMIEFIKAGMFFWSKIQNKDGSFNEWFPNEHSHVATAFTTYAISESWLLLKDTTGFNDKRFEAVLSAIKKSGLWLSKNTDKIVSNHVAAAIMAMHNVYLITGDKKIQDAVERNLEIMQGNQHDEGWFLEYGGADIGYLTVSLDFLAKFYQKTKDATARRMLEGALDFLIYFIHPDGSTGGVYGSRNTNYLFLHGLKILSSEFASARHILQSICGNNQVNPLRNACAEADDRYFVFFFLGNLLQASLEQSSMESSDLNVSNFTKVFPASGLLSLKNSNFHIVCNCKKGGVLKVFTLEDRGVRLFYSDAGYFGCLGNGAVISTQYLLPEAPFNIEEGSDGLIMEINQQFCFVDINLPLTPLFIPFRLFNYTLGYFNSVANYFNRLLKSFIVKKKKAPLLLKRKLEIRNDAIVIHDRLSTKSKIHLSKLNIQNDVTAMYSPTSRYFTLSDFMSNSLKNNELSRAFRKTGALSLSVELKFGGRKPSLDVRLNGSPLEVRFK